MDICRVGHGVLGTASVPYPPGSPTLLGSFSFYIRLALSLCLLSFLGWLSILFPFVLSCCPLSYLGSLSFFVQLTRSLFARSPFWAPSRSLFRSGSLAARCLSYITGAM